MSTLLRHTGLVVVDLDTAVGFWCNALGFKVVRRMEESGESLEVVTGLDNVVVTTVKLVDPNGSMLELLQFHSHPDISEWMGTPFSTGLTHIALTVEDIEAVCKKVVDLGGTHNPVCVSSDGRVRMTFCRGPEGLLLELVEESGQ